MKILSNRIFQVIITMFLFCATGPSPVSAQPTLTFSRLEIDQSLRLIFSIAVTNLDSEFSDCTFNLRVANTKANLKKAANRALAKVATSVNSDQVLNGLYSGYTNSLEQGPTKNILWYKGILKCPASEASAAFTAQTEALVLDHSVLDTLPSVAFKTFAKHLRKKWEEF